MALGILYGQDYLETQKQIKINADNYVHDPHIQMTLKRIKYNY